MVKLGLASAFLLLGASTSYLPQAAARLGGEDAAQHAAHAALARDQQLWQREEVPGWIEEKRELSSSSTVDLAYQRAIEDEEIFLDEKRKRELERHEIKKRAICSTSSVIKKASSTTSSRRSTSTTSSKRSTSTTSSKRSSSTTSSTSKKTTNTVTASASSPPLLSTSITSVSSSKITSSTKAVSSSSKPITTSSTKSSSTSSSTRTTSSSTTPTSTRTSTSTTSTSTSRTSTSTTSTSTSRTTTTTSVAPTTTSTSTSTKASITSTLAVEPTTTGSWSLVEDYSGTTFFDKWDFFTWGDPTNGNVAYQGQAAAMAANLSYFNSKGQAITAVDSTNDYAYGVNRPSVRLQSKRSYSNGLVIWDIEHMPVGCAVWPALWSNGPGTWPNGGEIDVLEGVGDQDWNSVTLHTAQGCRANASTSSNKYSGYLSRSNCYAYNSPVGGCAITSGTASNPNYGSGVNAKKGGVYASRFDVTGVTVWFIPRASIPSDITTGKPTPDAGTWPEPIARYSSRTCNTAQYFGPQTLIVTMTLCGNWAGSPDVYGANWVNNGERYCPGNCTARVMEGANFKDAYFTFNSVKVYQQPSQ